MKTVGGLLLLIGAVVCGAAFFLMPLGIATDAVADLAPAGSDFDGIANLSLMHQREMVLHTGLALSIIGAVLFAVGSILDHLVEASQAAADRHRAADRPEAQTERDGGGPGWVMSSDPKR